MDDILGFIRRNTKPRGFIQDYLEMPGGDPETPDSGPPEDARAVAARGLSRRPEPEAQPAESPSGPTDDRSPAATVRDQGSAAVPHGGYRIPTARELARLWHQNNLDVADDPVLAKMVAPQQEQLRRLAMVQHNQSFRGDPMASPEEAARYARHWGEFGGMFGEPMTPDAAAKWGDYVEGRHTKRVKEAKEAMMQGDLPGINRHVQELVGPGWQATGVEASTYDVGGQAVPSRKVTLKGPDGQEQVVDTVEFELGQANLETRWKIARDQAEAARKRTEEEATAPTRALERENKQLEAEGRNRQLKQQRDNPAAAGPAVEMTKPEEEAAKSYFKQQEEINKSEASAEVKLAQQQELDQRFAPVLQRVYPHLTRSAGPSPEARALFGLDPAGGAAASGGPAGGGQSAITQPSRDPRGAVNPPMTEQQRQQRRLDASEKEARLYRYWNQATTLTVNTPEAKREKERVLSEIDGMYDRLTNDGKKQADQLRDYLLHPATAKTRPPPVGH